MSHNGSQAHPGMGIERGSPAETVFQEVCDVFRDVKLVFCRRCIAGYVPRERMVEQYFSNIRSGFI